MKAYIRANRKNNELIAATSKATLTVSLMVLHDKFGFGEQRLNRFIDEYYKQVTAYNEGRVETVKDFTDVLKEECGIVIE